MHPAACIPVLRPGRIHPQALAEYDEFAFSHLQTTSAPAAQPQAPSVAVTSASERRRSNPPADRRRRGGRESSRVCRNPAEEIHRNNQQSVPFPAAVLPSAAPAARRSSGRRRPCRAGCRVRASMQAPGRKVLQCAYTLPQAFYKALPPPAGAARAVPAAQAGRSEYPAAAPGKKDPA